ncbi:MAG TPA: LamG domain-containing protein, partial [Planctomycetes bacterium]|nr:LamG domain-containing protein [Planctomycetota bacterium]
MPRQKSTGGAERSQVQILLPRFEITTARRIRLRRAVFRLSAVDSQIQTTSTVETTSPIMLRVPLFAVLILSRPLSVLQADDQSWPLDSSTTSKLSVRGDVTATTGVSGNCAVLDGASLLKLKNSEGFTNGETGFTLSAWVNPYLLGGRQQMIAAKNRYSLGERQWGVMIDKDNHFRLYVWQDRWATVDCSRLPKPGHWHLIGVVVRPASAELWVNGKLAGKVKLTKAISRTEAPLTIGGVDDDGRIRQNLVGAIDEVRLFDRPLDAKELTAAYKPIAATHEIPNFASRMNVAANPQAAHLWSDNATLPATADAEVLTDVTFRVIKKWEPDIDGYKWLHGVALAWHKDKLYASFGHNKGRENTVTEEGRYCVSSDDGRTWSDIRTMDVGTESDNLAISHGVFLSRGAELWAFLGAFHNTRQKVHTRAYTLDEQGGQWQPRGVVVDDGFWPMNEPIRMSDGNWIMPGFIAGSGNPAAVVISEGDDLTKWKLVVIPRGEVAGKMWGESSITVD